MTRSLFFSILSVLLVVLMPLDAARGEELPRQPVNGAERPAIAPVAKQTSLSSQLVFEKSGWIGSMWRVPDAADEVIIAEGVTLTGNILVPSTRTKPLLIRGEDRFTSRIVGTGTHQWFRVETDLSRRHSAIFVDTGSPVTIRTLTSYNPDKYHFTGYGHTLLIVEDVDIIDDRLAYRTDGIAGGEGTEIRNVFIDTYDDAIKIYYPGMLIEDTIIVHNRNGAPLQFGWGGEQGFATIRNLTVIANEPEIYNQGVFARAAQRREQNKRPLAGGATIDGFRLIVPDGKKMPPLFMWGTPDGLKIHDFTMTITGLCTGADAPYAGRDQLEVVPRGNDDTVKLVTPDCD